MNIDENSKKKASVIDLEQARESKDKIGSDVEEFLDDHVENDTEVDDCELLTFESIIDQTIHKFRDVQEVASVFIPGSAYFHNKQVDTFNAQADKVGSLLDTAEAEDQRAAAVNKLNELMRKKKRLENARVPETLSKAMFLNLFSDFDSFTGKLLKLVFLEKSELLYSSNKSITYEEMMKFTSLEEVKLKLIDDWIDVHRRESYVEQFKRLEKNLGFKTLREFKNWPLFVEMTQRRNILMHCDGIVTEQYVDLCKQVNVKGVNDELVGTELFVDQKYLSKSTEILTEVVVKLTHTIWRKHFPEEHENADRNLNGIVFDYLSEKDWSIAKTLAQFGTEMRPSNDMNSKLILINYAIACKFGDLKRDFSQALKKMDFSSCILDLKLAEAVLRDDFQEAASIMRKIGKDGELISNESYHNWPIFLKFRDSKEFLSAYSDIYGYTYSSDLFQSISEEKDEEPEQDVNVVEKE